MNTLYFDNAATTKVKKEVLNAMFPYLSEEYGNASSIYSIGRRAKKAIENARIKVAELIGAKPNEIYFTGSGSESDNTALKGIAYANIEKGNHIITSKIEHPAILESCKCLEEQGFKITYLNVDSNGFVDLDELQKSISDGTILISIMFANNEIGTIEPIEKIAQIAQKYNIIFHTDSVQAVGNIPIDVNKLGIDMLSLSAHKFYGPKGVGALYVKSGINFRRFLDGGHQEKNKRAGTENIAGIVGLGAASKLAKDNLENHMNHLQTLRDYYIKKVEENILDIKINGSRENRLPGNANISFKSVDSNAILLELDKRGICASSGSACSSGIVAPSHVLVAIGLTSEWEKGALRVTFGEDNTKEDVDFLIEALKEIVSKLREMAGD